MSSSSSFFQQVQPKAGTPGVAEPSGAPSGAPAQAGPPSSMVTMLLPFLILVPFLFLSFRRQKKEKEARGSLKKGDRVVTQSGLIGELVDLDDMLDAQGHPGTPAPPPTPKDPSSKRPWRRKTALAVAESMEFDPEMVHLPD